MQPGAVLLVGGRSTRMGRPKAGLDWHGEPLAARVARVLARAVGDGPVVAVTAPGQQVPALPAGVELVADPDEGEGPLRGLAVGLAALRGRADVAFVSSVDAPFLHAPFVAAVLGALGPDHDVALPVAHGHRHPLAAAYRVELTAHLEELLASGERRLRVVPASTRTRFLDEAALRAAGLGLVDPALDAVRNVNSPEDYEEARAEEAPRVVVDVAGALGRRAVATRLEARAWRLDDAVRAAGLALDGRVVAVVNGVPVGADGWYPLARGDRVALSGADERSVPGMTSHAVPDAIPTSLVGSYAQPDWLIDRERLRARLPPRVRATELSRIDPQYLEEAQDDATLLAIRDQERAGIDIVTDGEARRESYSNRFATALDGVDVETPGVALDRSGHPNPVPRVFGPVQRRHPVQVRDVEFLRANTNRPIKITVPGPFTMAQQAQNDAYETTAELAMAYAAAVHDEIVDLFAAGADIVQIDEPYLQARPEPAREFGVAVIERALDGVVGTTALHICFGYAAIIHERPEAYSFLPELASSSVDQISIETAQSGLDTAVLKTLPGKRIILGVIDLEDHAVETPETVADRIRRALPNKRAEELVAAPDCGMKYLPRDVAYGKLEAMVAGAAMVRAEV